MKSRQGSPPPAITSFPGTLPGAGPRDRRATGRYNPTPGKPRPPLILETCFWRLNDRPLPEGPPTPPNGPPGPAPYDLVFLAPGLENPAPKGSGSFFVAVRELPLLAARNLDGETINFQSQSFFFHFQRDTNPRQSLAKSVLGLGPIVHPFFSFFFLEERGRGGSPAPGYAPPKCVLPQISARTGLQFYPTGGVAFPDVESFKATIPCLYLLRAHFFLAPISGAPNAQFEENMPSINPNCGSFFSLSPVPFAPTCLCFF